MEALALIGLIIMAIAISTGLGFVGNFSMKEEEEYAGFVVTTIVESIIIAIMLFVFIEF